MKLIKALGATSEIWQVFIMDSSSSTGAGLINKTSADFTAYYHRDTDTTATAISLVTMTIGTFTSGGFKKIDDTNMPGWYQFCPPNAALASGAKSCGFHLSCTGAAPLPIECQLVAFNPEDAVRLGLTALPNAAAEAAGGLYTRGSGAGQIAQQANGQADVNLSTIKTQSVTCAAGVTVLASVGTAATSTAQTGDNFARLGAPAGASVSADIVAINAKTTNLPAAPASTTNITAGTITTVTNLTNAAGVTSNIKKNSASRITFVMTDSTTHAPKTGCTVTAQVSLDGAALASCANSPSEISSGLYTLVLAAADTNANELAYRLTASSADDLVIERVTQP